MKTLYPFSKNLKILLFAIVCLASSGVFAQSGITLQWDSEVGCLQYDEDRYKDQPVPIEEISADECIKVCEQSVVSYTLQPGNTIIDQVHWTADGGQIITGNTGNSIDVKWTDTNNPASLNVEITLDDSTVNYITLCVQVKPKPMAKGEIAGMGEDPVFCLNTDLYFENLSTAPGDSEIASVLWDFGDGTTSSEFEPVHSYSSGGNKTVILTVWDECNCSDSYKFPIKIARPALTIECPTVTCEGSTEHYYLGIAPGANIEEIVCDRYKWTVEGGHIVGSASQPEVDVIWDNVDEDGFGYVHFDQSECEVGCRSTLTAKIPVIQNRGRIKGKSEVCQDEQSLYHLPQWPTTDFQWTLYNSSGQAFANATILTDQRNQIAVDTHNLTPGNYKLICHYTNTLLGCGGTAELRINVTGKLKITDGPSELCEGESDVFQANFPQATLTWTLTKNNQVLAQTTTTSFQYQFTEPGYYTLTATASDYCSSDPFNIQVYDKPDTPTESIDGPGEICPGTTYDYTYMGSNTENLHWEAVNASINGPDNAATVSVTFEASGPYQLLLSRVNSNTTDCDSDPLSKPIDAISINTAIQAEPPFSPNNTDFCTSSEADFSVDYTDGEIYDWSIAPPSLGNISSGQGTPNVHVTWNEVSGNNQGQGQLKLSIRKCNVFTDLNYDINLKRAPNLSLYYPSQTCAIGGFAITVLTDIDVNSGNWTLDLGNGQTYMNPIEDNPQHFTFNASYPNVEQNSTGSFTITLENANGCTNSSFAQGTITVLPTPIASISTDDENAFCETNQIYTLLEAQVQGGNINTNFQWYKSTNGNNYGGTAIPNANTSTLLIDNSSNLGFGNYYVRVSGQNGCYVNSQLFPIVHKNCNPPSGGNCDGFDEEVSFMQDSKWDSCQNIHLHIMNTGSPSSYSWEVQPDNNNISEITGNTTMQENDYNVTTPGIYSFTYTAFYNNCAAIENKTITVGYKALLGYDLTCTNSGNYDLTLFNNSPSLPNWEPNMVDYEITDSNNTTYNPVNADNDEATFSLPAGHYDMTLTIQKTTGANTGPVCSITRALDIAPFPDASFALPAETCANDPVGLAPDEGNVNGHSYEWSFNGTTNLLNSFNAELEDGLGQDVKLTITDEYGCTSIVSHQIDVHDKPTYVGDIVGNGTFCSGQVDPLHFAQDPGDNTSISSYQWMYEDHAIPGADGSTYTPTQSGLYWLVLTDNNGCKANISGVQEAILPPPHLTYEAPDEVCAGHQFSITGDVSPHSAEYRILREGQEVVGFSQDYPILYTTTENTPGTYTYTIEMEGTETACTASQSIDVTVIPSPTLTVGMQLQTCEPYKVTLTASANVAGAYTWSNGASGQNIDVQHGGAYFVRFIPDDGACPVDETLNVPKRADQFLWVFPDGCFEFCRRPQASILGPIAQIDQYNWLLDNTTVASGNTVVDPYHVPSNDGGLQLQLQNGQCPVTSDPLKLSYKQDCYKCDQPIIQNIVIGNPQNTPFTVYPLQVSLANPYNFPITGQIDSYTNDGTYIPGSFNLAPGQMVTANGQFIPNTGFAGGNSGIKITVRNEGQIICQDLSGVSFPAMPQPRPERGTVELKASPNPFAQTTHISYCMPARAFTTGELRIYTLGGNQMAKQNLGHAQGGASFDGSTWPSATYIAVLYVNGKNMAQAMLIKK